MSIGEDMLVTKLFNSTFFSENISASVDVKVSAGMSICIKSSKGVIWRSMNIQDNEIYKTSSILTFLVSGTKSEILSSGVKDPFINNIF